MHKQCKNNGKAYGQCGCAQTYVWFPYFSTRIHISDACFNILLFIPACVSTGGIFIKINQCP